MATKAINQRKNLLQRNLRARNHKLLPGYTLKLSNRNAEPDEADSQNVSNDNRFIIVIETLEALESSQICIWLPGIRAASFK